MEAFKMVELSGRRWLDWSMKCRSIVLAYSSDYLTKRNFYLTQRRDKSSKNVLKRV